LSETVVQSPSPLAGQELDALLADFRDIPTIPEVLVRIWQLVDDPRSSAKDLEVVVSMEPPLAAKVLRLANSPYYGGRGRIGDVRMAITALGFDTLRNLAVCLSVAQGLAGKKGADRVLDRKALWRHSVATAVLSRRFAPPECGEEAFTAGLLHDIGKFVISLGRPEAYGEIARRAIEDEVPFERAEREVLGFDHATAGAAFARQWNFPDKLQAWIHEHHRPPAPGDDATLRAVRLADRVAHALGVGAAIMALEAAPPDADDLEAAGLDFESLVDHEEELREDISRAHEFMNLI